MPMECLQVVAALPIFESGVGLSSGKNNRQLLGAIKTRVNARDLQGFIVGLSGALEIADLSEVGSKVRIGLLQLRRINTLPVAQLF